MSIRALLVLAGAVFWTAAIADDYEGTYRGQNSYWDASVELTLRDGRATIRTNKDGRTRSENGTYNRNVISFGGAQYGMKLEKNGIWLTQRGVGKNRAFYTRVGSGGGIDTKPNPQLAGTYSGYNPMWNQKWHLTLYNDGRAAAKLYSEGDVKELGGSWVRRPGMLDLELYHYRMNRRGNTLYLENETRSSDSFTLTRGNGSDDSRPPTDVPSWLIGTFRGFARDSGSDVVMTVQSGGNAVLEMTRNRNVNRYEGTYRNGRIVLENGNQWLVARSNGGITITNSKDSSQRISLSERDSIYDKPPTGLVGTFTGRHWDGYAVTLSIHQDGNATMSTGNRSRVSGGYRNGVLRLGGREYTITAKSNGVRIWEVGTQDRADLTRLNR